LNTGDRIIKYRHIKNQNINSMPNLSLLTVVIRFLTKSYYKGTVIFIFLFSLIIYNAKCQYLIQGKIVDENKEPVPFASVALLNARDSSLVQGVVSNLSGRFQIFDLQPERHLLSISAVGYRTTYLQTVKESDLMEEIQLGEVIIIEDVRQLGEVIIQAQKPLYEQQIDRLVVNVESNIGASGGTALDVLERSPGVIVDRMNNAIALSGKQGVRIMINGKLTKMPLQAAVQMLDGMNAENIEKIELITTPPAKYEAEGDAGIINIVTKKTADAGTNGNVSVFSGYGRKEIYGGSINFNHRNKNFNLFGDYSFRRDVTLQFFDTNRIVQVDNEPISTITENDRNAFTRIHNGRIGFDWNIGSKTTLGGVFSTFHRRWEMDAFADIIETIDTDLPTSIEMTTIELNKWKLYIGNINLSHDLGDNQNISIDIDHINYDSSNPTDYFQDFFDEQGNLSSVGALSSRKVTPIATWVSKIDYSAKVSDRLTIEAGAKGSFSQLENEIIVDELVNGALVNDEGLTSDADMRENIGAGYASATINASSTLDLQFGLRYEHTITNIDTRDEQNIVDRNFGNLFPSIFINNKINKDNSWVLSYSRRVTRPSFFQLAPFVIFNDPNSFFSGNVSLLPSLTDAVKAEFRHKSVLVSLQYSHDKNAISLFQPRIDENNRQVSAAENMDFRDNYSINLSFPIQVTDWWEMQFNSSGNFIKIKASYLEDPIELTIGSFNFNGSQKFSLPKEFKFEISGFFQSKQFFGISEFLAFGSLNLGFEKKFTNSSLRASYNDILGTNKWRWVTDIPDENLDSDLLIDFETRVFRLTYSRSFGNNKLRGKRRNQTGSEEEQRRFN